METQSLPPPKYWALLIGINYYGCAEVPKLRGAVEDVRIIKEYLIAQGVDEIRCFTATEPTATTAASMPREDPSDWPTYENIVQHLRSIVQKSKAGDKVYIHFSGHGVRPPQHRSEVRNPESGDLVLAVFDHSRGVRYFRTIEITSVYLKELVRNQVFVTVTLDCCCSGSVVRHGRKLYSTVREVPFDPRIDNAFPKFSLDDAVDSDVLRGASPRSDQLLSPAAYVILVACSQHERAEEIELLQVQDKKEFHGAFSYYLLKALRACSGEKVDARRLYEQVRCKLRLYVPKQTPAVFGDQEVTFFGGSSMKQSKDLIIATRRKGEAVLKLSAGVAHGVLLGDEFSLWPDGSHGIGTPVAHAKATDVDGLESEIMILDLPDTKVDNWWAKRISLKSWKAHAAIMLRGDSDRFLELSGGTRFLKFIPPDQEERYDYCVASSQTGDYQILNEAMEPIDLVDSIPSGTPAGILRVVRTLEHLAFFRYVAAMENENPNDNFEKLFAINLVKDGSVVQGQDTTVQQKEKLELKVENLGKNALHLAVLLMSPLWGIEEILSTPEGQDYRVVPPKEEMNTINFGASGERSIPIEMTIDEALAQRGKETCRDIIKVFVTSISSPFSILQQKDITELTGFEHEISRGAHRDLSTFLSSLSEPRRGKDASMPAQDWSVRTFYVETT